MICARTSIPHQTSAERIFPSHRPYLENIAVFEFGETITPSHGQELLMKDASLRGKLVLSGQSFLACGIKALQRAAQANIYLTLVIVHQMQLLNKWSLSADPLYLNG